MVGVDNSHLLPTPHPLTWAPDGSRALYQPAEGFPGWSKWPRDEAEPTHNLPGGRWAWLDPGRLGRVDRQHLRCLSLDPQGTQEALAKAPAGQRWVAIKGLKRGGWVALRWDPVAGEPGLSTSRGTGWPLEHLRLPSMSGLTPRSWSWGDGEKSWLMLESKSRSVLGWTFPQGLEWLHRPARAQAACHVDAGAAWAEDCALLHWDPTSQELGVWEGTSPLTGLAWNPTRQWVAATSGAGVDLIQLTP